MGDQSNIAEGGSVTLWKFAISGSGVNLSPKIEEKWGSFQGR